MNAKQKIIDRIDMMESKDVFIANDFFDIAGYETIKSVLNRLVLSKEIKRIINGIYYKPKYIEYIGEYESPSDNEVAKDIERKINQVCVKHGLDYEKNVRVPILDRAVSFILESPTDPKIIIDVSYSVTTSSAQGDKKNAARKTEDTLKKEREKGNQIIYVNFLDGAGWIGRQADMREIHRCSDYVINFNNLNLIEDIITSYVENHM